ncbi:hypothetical protein [Tardiphaga robiniae]|uniref:Uncharacterized protein n=1 Tax=Tardiphaga robiniae TaxID=943830 RepID=A0A7G6TVM7_9BRAD|nr:hypothetical protein [Tardiphaga robiniae]QND70809.1 hypothetical protein HB776_05850 [Tardiphaga robiniae]
MRNLEEDKKLNAAKAIVGEQLVAALMLYARQDEWSKQRGNSPWRLLFNSSEKDGDGCHIAEAALATWRELTAN